VLNNDDLVLLKTAANSLMDKTGGSSGGVSWSEGDARVWPTCALPLPPLVYLNDAPVAPVTGTFFPRLAITVIGTYFSRHTQATILDLHSGAISKQNQFVDVYKVLAAENETISSDVLQAYRQALIV
jgi:hypothetical protein